jgi:hypothetical protein
MAGFEVTIEVSLALDMAFLGCPPESPRAFTSSELALRQCDAARPVHTFHAGPLESRVRRRATDQAYFLTAFSMAPPALAKSSGIMTG